MTNLRNDSPVRSPLETKERSAVRSAAPVRVCFTFPRDLHASSVSVVGDFNDWDPERGRMQQTQDGSFVSVLAIMPGRSYQYRFLMDGDRWTNDWSAQSYAPNSFGGVDSVLDLTDDAVESTG